MKILIYLAIIRKKIFKFFLKKFIRQWSYAKWASELGHIGKNTLICKNVVINQAKYVFIGSQVSINDFCHIWGKGGVRIGDYTLIAAGTIITSQSHEIGDKLYLDTHVEKPIIIGKNVWIGSGSIILPGVEIGDSSIIGAGSVVTRDIPANVLAIGQPARVVKKLNQPLNIR